MQALTFLRDSFSLVRVRQWYKNLLVFLALFFSGQLFVASEFLLLSLAFLSLSFVASSYYIINDLIDLKKDSLHPEKKHRPLASGRISTLWAIFLVFLCLFAGLWLAFSITLLFFYFALLLFFVSVLYSIFLKKILFADVLTIAVLFVLRAISGAFVIGVVISPWLILCPFFLALFLALGKRHADLLLLGPVKKAVRTRKVLGQYTLELTSSMMLLATSLLVISYALYSFLSPYNFLLYTLPFALFVVFRYYALVQQGSPIAREPGFFFKDWQLVVGVVLWLALTYLLIYML